MKLTKGDSIRNRLAEMTAPVNRQNHKLRLAKTTWLHDPIHVSLTNSLAGPQQGAWV